MVAKQRGFAVERLALRNSGDAAGDKRSVVGYGAWAFLGGP
jgi:AmmeMemoRadiSam system protein B